MIVAPCYNEEAVLPESAPRIADYLAQLISAGKASPESKVVLVNDGSRDRTWALIREISAANPLIAGISLSRNFGHQAALLSGLHVVPGDAIVSIDADLQDDLNAIGEMLDRYYDGFDIVYGVRRERKTDSLFKRNTALAFYKLMAFLGTRSVYNHADFRLMSRRALNELRNFREINLFLRGMVPLVGFPSTSVFYDRSERLAGETKYPFRKMLSLSLSAITAFSNVPLRLITMTALAGIGVLIVLAIWVLWTRLFTGLDVPGWTSILLPTLFVGCLNLLAVGVIGEYLARIYEEIKARPRYVISEMVNMRSVQPAATEGHF